MALTLLKTRKGRLKAAFEAACGIGVASAAAVGVGLTAAHAVLPAAVATLAGSAAVGCATGTSLAVKYIKKNLVINIPS